MAKNYDSELITIELTKDQWEEIASACISVADFDLINKRIKDTLRKTYFTIKAETR